MRCTILVIFSIPINETGRLSDDVAEVRNLFVFVHINGELGKCISGIAYDR